MPKIPPTRPPDDDPPILDWESAPATELDDGVTVLVTLEPDTAPHSVETLPGYEIGFRAGTERKANAVYEEGQADLMASARKVLLGRGQLTNEQAENLLKLFWQGRTRL